MGAVSGLLAGRFMYSWTEATGTFARVILFQPITGMAIYGVTPKLAAAFFALGSRSSFLSVA